MVLQAGEILFAPLCDFDGGEKFRVEALGREAERRRLVAAYDLDEIVRPQLIHGPQYPLGSVVIRRDRQRPVSEDIIVLLEESRGSPRGIDRIAALVERR